MCGLTFLFVENESEGSVRERTDRALTKMAHRGPDAQGIVAKNGWALGHRRLSIIDLDASHQPMSTQDGRYHLVYNGEVYNYKDLRQQLSGKWQFRTAGDTEVVLAGLILNGSQFLSVMEGMWALALWDSVEERLFLARDRMGKKPLYYRVFPKGISCCSELPVLRVLDGTSWGEDTDSTADYFRFGYYMPGYTAWRDVYEVLPGHWLQWKPSNRVIQEAYWRLPIPNGDHIKPSDDELRTALEAAVCKRLVADVEVGAFLSGGIDSSLICALAQPFLDRPLKSYTIGFADKSFDERPYAEHAAHFIGTDHHVEELPSCEEADLEALLLNHLGQPFSDASLLPTALVSRVAAQDVKVVLSGDGGDELFGGYQRYQARIILRWYTRLPLRLRKGIEAVLRSLPEPTAHHSRSLLKKAHLFVDIAQRQRAETPYTAPLMYHPDEYARLFPGLVGQGHEPPALLQETTFDDLQRMLYADSLIYLPQDILVKVDRASMAHGLEIRAPFLDHRVIELAFSSPASYHVALGLGKRWLRKAYGPLLPKVIWKRRKQGFGVPLHQWFREDLGEKLKVLLESAYDKIDRTAALGLLGEHRKGVRDNGYRLWQMYVYLTVSQERR